MKQKTFFLVSQVLSFRHQKQASKNVADTTFKDIKFPVKVRDIHKIEKVNFIDIQSMHQKKCRERKHVYLEKECKRHYVLIKDFNTLMYNDTLHSGRKLFYRSCLQAFILKIALELMENKRLLCLK